MFDTVKEPVQFGAPGTAVGLIKLGFKILQRLFPGFVHLQCTFQILDIVHGLEFRNARAQHHDKQRYEQVGVVVQRQVGFVAKSLESKTEVVVSFMVNCKFRVLTLQTLW